MTMKSIRLELARDHEFPDGSNEHGYEFVAPLAADGSLDAAEWKHHRGECTVTRFWGDEDEESGHLIRKPGGAWAFHYDGEGNEDDDDSGYRFNTHVFELGAYVSLKEQDGKERTFRVVRIRDAR
ncbi:MULTISPECIES: hypothetical protein [Rhodomicrobium]|uniref:hypothetical protein n=1 Tax=Rhodomicrobium TaxID=1068 RepID=UPI000B4B8BE0|nr:MULTISPECIES: hypothetical protein [Rhodomicrobium]